MYFEEPPWKLILESYLDKMNINLNILYHGKLYHGKYWA